MRGDGESAVAGSATVVARLLDAFAAYDSAAVVASGAPALVGVGAFATVPVGASATVGRAPPDAIDADALVVTLFHREGASLVRLARLFVDDRNAAEDLVQEAFIRLRRAAHRIQDPAKAAPYLRSIVLNLARDSNRRGLVSMRHHLPFDDRVASVEDEITLRDDQRAVIEALRDLPHRQRDCLMLRYYSELGIADIAATLGLSPNSVKTHLQRGLASLERRLGDHAPVTTPEQDPDHDPDDDSDDDPGRDASPEAGR